MRTILMPLLGLLTTACLQAQVPESNIREADAMWSKRVWREIDLREKINLPLYYPTEASEGYQSLFAVLSEAIKKEYLTAYSVGPLGQTDDFSVALSPEEVRDILFTSESTWTYDLDTDQPSQVTINDSIRSTDIMRYRIKEEWVFDKQRSVMDVRILGISPLKEVRGESGEIRGYTPLFWVYFPEARWVLARSPVFIRHNDNQALNYDDIFVKRFFHGHVIKVSNVYDRHIQEYTSGIDALIEGERLEEEIRIFEHDLWSH